MKIDSYSKVEFSEEFQFLLKSDNNTILICGKTDNLKWIQFLCPCGCSEVVRLRLTENKDGIEEPFWNLECDQRTQKVSISPSVDSVSFECKSHYFLTDNKIKWC